MRAPDNLREATYFYGNIDRERPFPIVADLARAFDGRDRVTQLAGDRSRLIPGHDPAVAERYEALPGESMIFDQTRPKVPAA